MTYRITFADRSVRPAATYAYTVEAGSQREAIALASQFARVEAPRATLQVVRQVRTAA